MEVIDPTNTHHTRILQPEREIVQGDVHLGRQHLPEHYNGLPNVHMFDIHFGRLILLTSGSGVPVLIVLLLLLEQRRFLDGLHRGHLGTLAPFLNHFLCQFGAVADPLCFLHVQSTTNFKTSSSCHFRVNHPDGRFYYLDAGHWEKDSCNRVVQRIADTCVIMFRLRALKGKPGIIR